MKVHPSALKHGISAADALQAADWSLWVEPLELTFHAVASLFSFR